MIKNLIYLSIAISILGFSIFGTNGVLELFRFQNQLDKLEKNLEIYKLESDKENNSLFGLKNNPGYLEKISREQLGLSKKDEIIYVFEEEKNQQ